MNVTVFGALFLVVTGFVYLFHRRWLLPLVCVSAVLQSPSVVDLRLAGSGLGITPFVVVGSLMAFDLMRRWRSSPPIALSAPARRVLPWWIAFVVVSLLSALVLPWIFEGTQVLSPLDKDGAHANPVPLAFSVSNLAQAVNLLLVAGVMGWLVVVRDEEDLPRRMFIGIVLAVVVSTLVGLQQRLAWNGLLPLGAEFWASNPTYAQNFRSLSGDIPRVNWPFVEASYASAWFASVLGGFVAMFLANVHRHKALAGAMVALFALGNTWGATGLLAASSYLVLALAVCAWLLATKPALRGGLMYRLTLAVLVSTCVALSTWLIVRHYHLGSVIAEAMQNSLQGRARTMLGDLRPHADRHGLSLLKETLGLGVGMGSHRGSSWLVTLASNVGLAGVVLFAIAMIRQWHELARLVPREPAASLLFFLGSSVAALIAVTIAIPDQNWPVFWVLVLGGLTCLLVEREPRNAIPEPTQPGGRLEPDKRPV